MRKLLYGVLLLFVAFIWGCTQDSIEESIYRDDAPKIYAYTDNRVFEPALRIEFALGKNACELFFAKDNIEYFDEIEL